MHGAVNVYVLWTPGRRGLARRDGGHVVGCGWFGERTQVLATSFFHKFGETFCVFGPVAAEDIAVIGEASNIRETIQKTAELHPDLIILDVNMPDKDYIAPTKVKSFLNGTKIVAITLGADDVKEELLHGVGAAKLLDKIDLSDQLIPAILELAPERALCKRFRLYLACFLNASRYCRPRS